jgi:saccharopepsin
MGKAGGGNGEITFGAIDDSRFKGEISWAPVIRKAYWEVAMEKASVDGKPVPNVSTRRAAIDTGTSLIAMSKADAAAINKMIGATAIPFQGGGMFYLECSKLASMPNLTFQFGGKDMTLTANDYTLQMKSWLGTVCISGISGIDLPPQMSDVWIVGDVFLRKYYTVYDYENSRVGFAEAA